MRQSGVLLSMTSLPSRGGIGAMGKAACEFVDFLQSAGMRIWQLLPVGPTGFADSPYASGSSHAGNFLLIDIPTLIGEGLLQVDALPDEPENQESVDFAVVREQKKKLLATAYRQSAKVCECGVRAFRTKESWVEDYALFAALKEHYDETMWSSWPDEAIRRRDPEALTRARTELHDEIERQVFIQYLFFRQWDALKGYANQHGVQLFGDMPIYIAEDSVDTWVNPELFMLDRDGRPTLVSGVPPDLYSEDGQRWGNPIFRWDEHRRTHYAWWIERMRHMARMYDLIRIDHFIGFANYYAIPAQYPNARIGKWHKGPGRKLFRALRRALPQLSIIAEDLGAVNGRVRRLLRYCGYPGMRVLQFCLGDADHLPENFPKHCVAYTGTHDNDTLLGWYASLNAEEQTAFRAHIHCEQLSRLTADTLQAMLQSRADTVILPMQDLLKLPTAARMNYPSTIGGSNWRWRMKPDALDVGLAERLYQLCRESGRIASE